MKNLAIVGLRILAIWALLKALVYVQYLPSLFVQQDDLMPAAAIGTLAILLIYLAFCLVLFLKTSAIAEKIAPGSSDASLDSIDYRQLASICFATAGLLIFFWSINTFLSSIGSLHHYRLMNLMNPDRFFSQIRFLLFGGGIQMIFGLCLFIGGKKIAGWWYNFRDWT
jgi:hypothetical protein